MFTLNLRKKKITMREYCHETFTTLNRTMRINIYDVPIYTLRTCLAFHLCEEHTHAQHTHNKTHIHIPRDTHIR